MRRGDVRQHLEHAERGCSNCCAAHANAATARCDGMARAHASAGLAHAVRALEHVPTEREPSLHHPAAHSMGHALQWLYLQTRAAIEHEHASEGSKANDCVHRHAGIERACTCVQKCSGEKSDPVGKGPAAWQRDRRSDRVSAYRWCLCDVLSKHQLHSPIRSPSPASLLLERALLSGDVGVEPIRAISMLCWATALFTEPGP